VRCCCWILGGMPGGAFWVQKSPKEWADPLAYWMLGTKNCGRSPGSASFQGSSQNLFQIVR
jgi:hypothetical protein